MLHSALAEITRPPPDRAPEPQPTQTLEELRFGPCRVIPGARLVLVDDRPLKLGSRAFDILVMLLRAKGRIVPRDDLIRGVWPTTTVDETNLRFQMGALRRALGDYRGSIKTIPGRGYMFALEVAPRPRSLPAPVDGAAVAPLLATIDAAGRAALRDLLHAVAEEVWSMGVVSGRPAGAPAHALREP